MASEIRFWVVAPGEQAEDQGQVLAKRLDGKIQGVAAGVEGDGGARLFEQAGDGKLVALHRALVEQAGGEIRRQ